MDRRSFIKASSGAAAALSGTATAAAGTMAAPALVSGGVRRLTLATPWPLDLPGLTASAQRLAARIETLSRGRIAIAIMRAQEGGPAAVSRGDADLYFDIESDSPGRHPALAYFAGLPFHTGLDPEDQLAWITIAGGQLLWDHLAAAHGLKPLLAGHTGPHPDLWLREPLNTAADLKGRRIHVAGLAQRVLDRVGAIPTRVDADQITDAIRDSRLDGAEWGGPDAGLMLGLHHAAAQCIRFGLNTHGTAVTLGVALRVWESFDAADAALFEAAAAEEVRLALAESRAHTPLVRRALAETFGVETHQFPAEISALLSESAEAAVTWVAEFDAEAQRIDASYRAFRKLRTGRDHGTSPHAATPTPMA